MSISFSRNLNINSASSSGNSSKNSGLNVVKDKAKVISNGNVKMNKIIENLVKQKENLIKQKQDIMDTGLKDNEDAKSIKAKLDEVDKQIKEIDKKITQAKLDDELKQSNINEKSKEAKKSKEKSSSNSKGDAAEKQSLNQLNGLLELTSNLSKNKILFNEKKSLNNEKKVLSTEISIDLGRGADPVTKEDRVAAIDDSSTNINRQISDNSKGLNTKMKAAAKNESSNNSGDNTIKDGKSKNSSKDSKNAAELSTKLQKAQHIVNKYKQALSNSESYTNSEKVNFAA